MPDSLYNGILWSNGNMEANSKNQTLAFNLTLYVLGENINEDNLLKQYRDMLKNDEANLPKKIT
jgi:hypothetical protein